MPKHNNQKGVIINLLTLNPNLGYRKIARKCNVSYSWVWRIAKENNLLRKRFGLTVTKAGIKFEYSRSAILGFIHRGNLQASKIGDIWYVPEDAVIVRNCSQYQKPLPKFAKRYCLDERTPKMEYQLEYHRRHYIKSGKRARCFG